MFVAQKIVAFPPPRFDQEVSLASDPVYLKHPKYASLRRLRNKKAKVELSVCAISLALRVALSGVPAELLLLFLPPRPRADTLWKQALSLPTDGEKAFFFPPERMQLGCVSCGLWNVRQRRGFVFIFLEGGEVKKSCDSQIWYNIIVLSLMLLWRLYSPSVTRMTTVWDTAKSERAWPRRAPIASDKLEHI